MTNDCIFHREAFLCAQQTQMHILCLENQGDVEQTAHINFHHTASIQLCYFSYRKVLILLAGDWF